VKKIGVILIFILVFALSRIVETHQIKNKRAKVTSLIEVGQSISQAQDILKREGFEFAYDKPSVLSGQGQHVMQLVIIGNIFPSIDDTFFYVLTGGANPLRPESPYVEIIAEKEGKIVSIE